MSDPKAFKDISIEELLSGLTGNPIKLDTKVNNSIPQFFKKFNISPGSFKIKKPLLYKLYNNSMKDDLSYFHFHAQTRLFLQMDEHFYYINEDIALGALDFLETKNQLRKININAYKLLDEMRLHYNIRRGPKMFSIDLFYFLATIYCRTYKKRKVSRRNLLIMLKKSFAFELNSSTTWFRTSDFIDRLTNDEKQLLIYKLTNVQAHKKRKNQKREKEIRRIKQACQFKVTEPPYRF